MTVLYIPLETTVLEGIQGQFNSMKENAVPGQILFFICCTTSSNNRIRLVPALTYIVIIPATRELRLVPALTSSILYCDHTSNKGTTVSSSSAFILVSAIRELQLVTCSVDTHCIPCCIDCTDVDSICRTKDIVAYQLIFVLFFTYSICKL